MNKQSDTGISVRLSRIDAPLSEQAAHIFAEGKQLFRLCYSFFAIYILVHTHYLHFILYLLLYISHYRFFSMSEYYPYVK